MMCLWCEENRAADGSVYCLHCIEEENAEEWGEHLAEEAWADSGTNLHALRTPQPERRYRDAG